MYLRGRATLYRPLFKRFFWLGLIAFGVGLAMKYETTPGAQPRGESALSQQGSIELAKENATLVLFAHPYCPCSQASIHELNELAAELNGSVQVQVYFYWPLSKPEGWVKSSLYKKAASIRNAKVLIDKGGREAKLLDAKISGHAYVFSPTGQMLFRGGLTRGRGVEGESLGQHLIREIAASRTKELKTGPQRCAYQIENHK